MLNRWIGIAAAALMLVANGALFFRDVIPQWFIGDPPAPAGLQLAPGDERFTQVGIFDGEGRRIGTSWTQCKRTTVADIIKLNTTTFLDQLNLPHGLRTPRVRFEYKLTFQRPDSYMLDPDRARSAAASSTAPLRIDEVSFNMYGLGVPVTFFGEAYDSGEFPCKWQVGPRSGRFVLDSRIPSALGDVIRPFDRLPGLYVGRTWRLDLLNPLAQVVPGLNSAGVSMNETVIRVTRREFIEHRGERIEVFVVEGGNATAWVADDGRVLCQEVADLPLLGKLRIVDEDYDPNQYHEALRLVPTEWQSSNSVRSADE